MDYAKSAPIPQGYFLRGVRLRHLPPQAGEGPLLCYYERARRETLFPYRRTARRTPSSALRAGCAVRAPPAAQWLLFFAVQRKV